LGEKLGFVSKQSIINILQGNKLKFILEFPSIVYADQGEVLFKYGKEVEILQNRILNITVNFQGELKGSVANKGKINGKVRLIEPHVVGQEFEQGEILVTRMTTPDLIPLIKKSKAIITDEGGITCHAAIVSREFNIPCIIGTKYATQVFKDGDLVEVDAERGIVRKID
jgi:phosphoenolpyruvate synthase/pyruvate phosphate dikinase